MKRLLVLAAAIVVLCTSVEAQRRRAVSPPQPPPPKVTDFGDPLAQLSPEEVLRFQAGRREFVETRTPENGLGPVYNGRTCLECHYVHAGGGGSGRVETNIASTADGVYDPLTHLGGSQLQAFGLGAPGDPGHRFSGERVPAAANVVSKRRSPGLFGLGLVEATDDATFIALAAQQRARGDGTAGRVALVNNIVAGMKTVGKFGWKAQSPTLQQSAGNAFLNQMGITNPLFPNENCPSGNCAELQFNPQPGLNDDGTATNAVADFVRFLGPPPRRAITSEVRAGEAVFLRIGCDSCHTPTLQTGRSSNPAFDRVTYHPYSDFLLHDMGALGDGIMQEEALPQEMRTAPLWGLRGITRFLHDGRAKSMEEAITLHGGQGLGAAIRFQQLTADEKKQLLAFLESL